MSKITLKRFTYRTYCVQSLFFSIFILSLFVGITISWTSLPKALECVQNNCYQKNEAHQVKNGEAICAEDEYGTKVGAPNCTAECMGLKIPEDQQQCFCDSCNGKSKKFKYFCKAPGTKHITEAECEATVCKGSGEIKWRGDHCSDK